MPGKFVDLTGAVFGKLLVLERQKSPELKHAASRWLCKCECGNTLTVRADSLRRGQQSCGCYRSEETIEKVREVGRQNKTHGKTLTSTYHSWMTMKARCSNPNSNRHSNYGGRGIKVCERWAKFENFLEDMGERPDGMSLDRINSDGDYEPGNCKWSTQKEQQNNRRNNMLIELDGVTMTLAQWSEKTGFDATTISTRIRRGWSCHDALTVVPRLGNRVGG